MLPKEMKIDQLNPKAKERIEAYLAAQAEIQDEQQAAWINFRDAAITLFCREVQIWLGDFWPDIIQAGALKTEFDGLRTIRITMPITFLGLKGNITANLKNKDKSKDLLEFFYTAKITIEFGIYLQSQAAESITLNLFPGGEGTQPVDARDLTEFATRIIAASENLDRIQAERAEREVFNAQNNHVRKIQGANTLDLMNEYLAAAIAEFPDMKAQFQQVADEHRAFIEQRDAKAADQAAAAALIEAEQQRLRADVDLLWAIPFTIFMITYGAHTDEGGTITQSFYSLQQFPDEDGFWPKLAGGQPSNRVKPVNLMIIDELIITGETQAPYEIKRWENVESLTMPDVSIFAALPPIHIVS